MAPPLTGLLAAPQELTTGDDDGFVLDLRVVELTTDVAEMRCGTSDGCGSTCQKSACTTSAFDPR